MKIKIIILFFIILTLTSCGKKGDPKYQNSYKKISDKVEVV